MKLNKVSVFLLILSCLVPNGLIFAQTKKNRADRKRKVVVVKQKTQSRKTSIMVKQKFGSWGGQGIGLVDVNGGGVQLEFDCADGLIKQPIIPDKQGNFSIVGTFTQNRPGPTRMDAPDTTQPALYKGKITGQTMTLTIELTEGKNQLGPYTLTANRAPRIMRCL